MAKYSQNTAKYGQLVNFGSFAPSYAPMYPCTYAPMHAPTTCTGYTAPAAPPGTGLRYGYTHTAAPAEEAVGLTLAKTGA